MQLFSWWRKPTRDREDPGTGNHAELLPPTVWNEEIRRSGCFQGTVSPGGAKSPSACMMNENTIMSKPWRDKAARVPRLFLSNLMISCCYYLMAPPNKKLETDRAQRMLSRVMFAWSRDYTQGLKMICVKEQMNNVNRGIEPDNDISWLILGTSKGSERCWQLNRVIPTNYDGIMRSTDFVFCYN